MIFQSTRISSRRRLCALSVLLTGLLSACGGGGSGEDPGASGEGGGSSTEAPPAEDTVRFSVRTGSDLNTLGSPLLSLNPGGPSGNQSQRAGDVLYGGPDNDVQVGGLGVDVLIGNDGDDVLIGGTEDFNSSVDGDGLQADNRDRAFGGNGDDVFIWAPGDGSDFFDGGPGTDVVIFGVLGELRDADGSTEGAPFFNVNPPNSAGSQDFDGIFLQSESNLPIVYVSQSPGFCSVIDGSVAPDELGALEVDQLVRFSLRAIAQAFDDGVRDDDDGLRVAVSLRNTEFLVCTRRDATEDGGENNIEVLDLRTAPAQPASIDDLPPAVRLQIG